MEGDQWRSSEWKAESSQYTTLDQEVVVFPGKNSHPTQYKGISILSLAFDVHEHLYIFFAVVDTSVGSNL